MSQDYKIMPKNELLDMIDDMKDQFEYQDKETLASIYRANNNYFILFPAVGIKGILAEKQSVLDSIIKSGIIPIEEEKPNLFQRDQTRLKNIEDCIAYYQEELSKKLNIVIDLNHFDTTQFNHINKVVRAMPKEAAYESLFIPMGVVFGEIQRLKINGKWIKEKRYGYNPYYEPVIIDSNGHKHDPWYFLVRLLLEKKFDIREYTSWLWK